MGYKVDIPARYVLVVFLFLGNMMIFSQRNVLGVAIIAMVNHTAVYTLQNEITSDECPETIWQNHTVDIKDGRYVWTQPTQGIILGSHFYGFAFAQLVGSGITFLLGPKKLILLASSLPSLFVVLTPFSANIGVFLISIFQAVAGIFHGLYSAAAITLLARWSPKNEKSTLLSICYSGTLIGIVIGMMLTGYLCKYGFSGGWPSSFYVFGTFGFILSVCFVFTVYERPNEHPRISLKELDYLNENVANIPSTENKLTVPWKDILTSKPVWVIAITKVCWGFGFYTCLTKLPAYLKIILHIPIQQNGLINALIYFMNGIAMFISGFIADFIIQRKYFNVINTRKIIEGVGMFIPALCLLSIPFLGCDIVKVTIFLTLAIGCFGFIGGGDFAIVLDLAPEFAGIIFALTNGLSCCTGIISPYLIGLLLDKDQGSMTEWSYVFYIISFIYFVGGVVFLLGATAELQPWAVKTLPKKEEINIK